MPEHAVQAAEEVKCGVAIVDRRPSSRRQVDAALARTIAELGKCQAFS
jgi:hypothetical protein